jgi:hypothetical protein
MVEYGDTRTPDPPTWTTDERNRLIEFVPILLDSEAARPHTDASRNGPMHPELKRFIDAVIVPALVERFLREQGAAQASEAPPRVE